MLSAKLTAVVIGVFVAAASGSAMAKSAEISQPDQVKVTVNYGDLDLTQEAGAQTLRRRFENAVTLITGESSYGPNAFVDTDRDAASLAARKAADAVIEARRNASAAPTAVSIG